MNVNLDAFTYCLSVTESGQNIFRGGIILFSVSVIFKITKAELKSVTVWSFI